MRELVVCPVHDEKETLERFLFLLREHYSGDVLFVDDGSIDGSREILESARDGRTFLLRHDIRQGYGTALNSGFRYSLEKGYNRIITLDADLQHDPGRIPEFLDALLVSELVLGSRYTKFGRCLDIPKDRLHINRYIGKLIELLFSLKFTDPFCGYRGYRDTFLKKIHLREKGYGLALEVLLEAARLRTGFREIPVEAVYLDHMRKFLDGLDDPRTRLLYYLGIISRKRTEMGNEKKILDHKPSSR